MRPWPSAVIFDLDGTLLDSVGDLAVALNATLAELGLAPHPQDKVRTMVGGGLAKLLDRALATHGAALPDAARDQAETRLFQLYAEQPAVLSRLYPGAAQTLRALDHAGIALGLCTNKPAAISRDLLQAMGIADSFGAIQGGDGDSPKKPDPAGLLRVVDELGAEPSTTLMVGDSMIDVQTARAAKLAGIVLVSHGYSVTPVTELGADMVIDGLEELPAAVAHLAAWRESRA